MLLSAVLALEARLKGMTSAVPKVAVTTDEGYAEILAERDRNGTKVRYPLVVMRSRDYIMDRSRYTNDRVSMGIHEETIADGTTAFFNDIDQPYLPYNLMYQIDLIAETRREIDAMVLWVMRNLKDRDCIDVTYKGFDGNDAVYQSLVKRGDILKADDKDGNVITLHRRIFELSMTTLLTADKPTKEILVAKVIPKTHHLVTTIRSDKSDG